MVRPRASEYSAATARMSSDLGPVNSMTFPRWPPGCSRTAATTSATSRLSTGDVFAAPNGRRIVPSFAIDSAAHCEKKKCWRKTVARTCTTGKPDQFSACSPSQCKRCWRESVIAVRLICETVNWEMLTNTSRSLRARATAAAVTVASR